MSLIGDSRRCHWVTPFPPIKNQTYNLKCIKLSHLFLKVPPLWYFSVSLEVACEDKEFVRWFGVYGNPIPSFKLFRLLSILASLLYEIPSSIKWMPGDLGMTEANPVKSQMWQELKSWQLSSYIDIYIYINYLLLFRVNYYNSLLLNWLTRRIFYYMSL